VGRLRGKGQLHVQGAERAVLSCCRGLGGRPWAWGCRCACGSSSVWVRGRDARGRPGAARGLTGLLRSCYLPMQLLQRCMPVWLLLLLLLVICVHLSSFGLACGATGASSSQRAGLHRRLAGAALTMEHCILEHARHQGVVHLLGAGMGLQVATPAFPPKAELGRGSLLLRLRTNSIAKPNPRLYTPVLVALGCPMKPTPSAATAII
jgi:hypothetical protein